VQQNQQQQQQGQQQQQLYAGHMSEDQHQQALQEAHWRATAEALLSNPTLRDAPLSPCQLALITDAVANALVNSGIAPESPAAPPPPAPVRTTAAVAADAAASPASAHSPGRGACLRSSGSWLGMLCMGRDSGGGGRAPEAPASPAGSGGSPTKSQIPIHADAATRRLMAAEAAAGGGGRSGQQDEGARGAGRESDLAEELEAILQAEQQQDAAIYARINAITGMQGQYGDTTTADRVAAALDGSGQALARARSQPLPGSGLTSGAGADDRLSASIGSPAAAAAAEAAQGAARGRPWVGAMPFRMNALLAAAFGQDDGQGRAPAVHPAIVLTPAELDARLTALYERTRDWRRRCEERYEYVRRERQGETLDECTFSPRINTMSRAMFPVRGVLDGGGLILCL
jgi:hypothetical protein